MDLDGFSQFGQDLFIDRRKRCGRRAATQIKSLLRSSYRTVSTAAHRMRHGEQRARRH